MAATLTPHSDHDAPGDLTAHHTLLILHVEYDTDETLLDFAGRLDHADQVTLANIRPAPAAALPPAGLMSDLGVMVYLDMRDACTEEESRLDLRVSARSRLLHELGIRHDVITETYHRSLLGRATQRGLRKAIGRVARHARADEILVGPGAILESQKIG